MKPWHASLQLQFSRQASGRSALTRRAHTGPALVQRSLYPEGPGICHAVVLHPPAGVAGGDAIDIDIVVAQGAHATLTTPGATRWYKANGKPARQTVSLCVAEGACLDWLPMENIFFEQADATTRTDIRLHPAARAVGWDISQLGAINKAGHWDAGRARLELTLRVGERLLWIEQGNVGARDPIRHSIAGLAGLPVHACLWCFGPTLAPEQAAALTGMMPWHDTLRAGMTAMPHGDTRTLYIVRAIGLHAEDVRNLLVAAWLQLRPAVLGAPARPLRLWRT